VRNDETGAIHQQTSNGFHSLIFEFTIDAGSRLIEDQNPWTRHKGTRQGNDLFFA